MPRDASKFFLRIINDVLLEQLLHIDPVFHTIHRRFISRISINEVHAERFRSLNQLVFNDVKAGLGVLTMKITDLTFRHLGKTQHASNTGNQFRLSVHRSTYEIRQHVSLRRVALLAVDAPLVALLALASYQSHVREVRIIRQLNNSTAF